MNDPCLYLKFIREKEWKLCTRNYGRGYAGRSDERWTDREKEWIKMNGFVRGLYISSLLTIF